MYDINVDCKMFKTVLKKWSLLKKVCNDVKNI